MLEWITERFLHNKKYFSAETMIAIVIFMFLLGCGVENPTLQDSSETAVHNWNSSLEELKQRTLERTCDQEMFLYYRDTIEKQSEYLTPEQITISMENMLADISCEGG